MKLKGLQIIVDHERCKMCGACTKSCFMGALSLSDGKIIRDNSLCKGCGLCITTCPNKAVSAAVDDLQAAVTELKGRIEALIDYR